MLCTGRRAQVYRIFYKTELFIGSGSLEQLKTYQNQAIFIVADPFLVQTGQLEGEGG